MKRIYICLYFIIASVTAVAQTDELNRLLDIVQSLRSGGEKSYNAAIKSLAADKLWTPMDELGRNNDAECRIADNVPGFRLNSVMTNAENKQRYQTTTGNHLNGSDSRFDYSLYEKTIRSGKTATYRLNKRKGAQTFLFVPYDGKGAGLKIGVKCGANNFTGTTLGNGVVKFTGIATEGNPVDVTVTNQGGKNASYVIINYNSRK